MSFQSLSLLLPKRLKQNGLSQPVIAAQAVEQANALLEQLFGQGVTQSRVQAVSVKYQRLCLACLDASLKQELKLREQEFVSLLNQRLGAPSVTQLQIVV